MHLWRSVMQGLGLGFDAPVAFGHARIRVRVWRSCRFPFGLFFGSRFVSRVFCNAMPL